MIYNNWNNKVDIIIEYIETKKRGKIEVEVEIIEKLVDFLNLRNTLQKYVWLKASGYKGNFHISFEQRINLLDYGFNITNNCNGCRICLKICPVNNINLENDRPIWSHNCEQCFACIQWCPKKSNSISKGNHRK